MGDGRRDELGPLADQYLDWDIYKIAGTKGECGVGVEMKWVHLRIADHILCLSFSNGRVLTETAAKNPLP